MPLSRPASPAGSNQQEFYRFTNEWTMKREQGFMWHLRDENDELIDKDQHRHDLIERYRLSVLTHYDPFA